MDGRNEIGYQFAGYFAQGSVPQPVDLPPGAVWKEIAAPFEGVGVRLPMWITKTPPVAEVEAMARRLGVQHAETWIYLSYETWGGAVDFVYGLGPQAGTAFGPVEDSTYESVEATFTGLMNRLGVSAEDAFEFPPFARGWWGEV